MPKTHIHPLWYQQAKVYCDGSPILKVGSTRASLTVEIWSKLHPFYLKSQEVRDSEGRVAKFIRKYGVSRKGGAA
jgi:large subunit ribosomal protein L31